MMTLWSTALIVAGASLYLNGYASTLTIPNEKDVQYSHHDREVSFNCPSIYGKFAHEHDCSLFYECRSGKASLKECSRNELFDTKSLRCRDKRKVKCNRSDEDSSSSSSEEDDSKEAQNFECPSSFGVYPHPVECSKYFFCSFDVVTLFQCRDSELYDDRRKKCQSDRRVDCGSRLDRDQMRTTRKPTTSSRRPTSTTANPTTKRFSKEDCPHSYGAFPHPTDCSKFLLCIRSVPTVKECRESQLFHPKYRQCLPKDKVTCETTNDRTTHIPTSTGKVTQSTTRAPTTTTRAPTTTTRAPTTTTRAPTTTTRAPTTTTRAPTTTTRAPTTTTRAPTTTTRAPTTTTPAPTTTTPAPTTTTQASTTQAPTTTTQAPITTTVTITFSPSPEIATKPNTPPTTDCDERDLDCIIDNTGDVKGWFDCPEEYGHFPHGGSRQLFIHCDKWHPFIKKCPEGTVFSPTYTVCDWE